MQIMKISNNQSIGQKTQANKQKQPAFKAVFVTLPDGLGDATLLRKIGNILKSENPVGRVVEIASNRLDAILHRTSLEQMDVPKVSNWSLNVES